MAVYRALMGFLANLCIFLRVTPEGLRRGRRGNLPAAQGAPFPEAEAQGRFAVT